CEPPSRPCHIKGYITTAYYYNPLVPEELAKELMENPPLVHLKEKMQPGGNPIQVCSRYQLTLKGKRSGGMSTGSNKYTPVTFIFKVIQCSSAAHFYSELNINMGNPR
ncbi:unnamed protein product, partial [marine sediment metagenome]